MGACLTSNKRRIVNQVQPQTEKDRARLSIGYAEADEDAKLCDIRFTADEDRSLLVQLKNLAEIRKVCNDAGKNEIGWGKAFSLGSTTDRDLHKVTSFASKEFKLEGDPIDFQSDFIGYACKKGLKPESPNQDSFLICKAEGSYAIYGVFDGHGRKGHEVSNFVKEHLPKLLLADENLLTNPEEALCAAFDETHKMIEKATDENRINAQRSGTTASIVLHDQMKRKLYVAHVGDSRCVLGRQPRVAEDSGRTWVAHDLTMDHKPTNPDEKARIESLGGQVLFDGFNYRVYVAGKRYPGLNMSRAMGDLIGCQDAGISHFPDVTGMKLRVPKLPGNIDTLEEETEVNKESEKREEEACEKVEESDQKESKRSDNPNEPVIQKGNSFCSSTVTSYDLDMHTDRLLMLASDGIWEFITSQEAVEIVGAFDPHQAMQAAEELASTSWDRWITRLCHSVVDDITAVVIFLN